MHADHTNNYEPRKDARTKKELAGVITKEVSGILRTNEDGIRILIYEVSTENRGECRRSRPRHAEMKCLLKIMKITVIYYS